MEFLMLYENPDGYYDVVYKCELEEAEDLIAEFEHYETFKGEDKNALYVYELMQSLGDSEDISHD